MLVKVTRMDRCMEARTHTYVVLNKLYHLCKHQPFTEHIFIRAKFSIFSLLAKASHVIIFLVIYIHSQEECCFS